MTRLMRSDFGAVESGKMALDFPYRHAAGVKVKILSSKPSNRVRSSSIGMAFPSGLSLSHGGSFLLAWCV